MYINTDGESVGNPAIASSVGMYAIVRLTPPKDGVCARDSISRYRGFVSDLLSRVNYPADISVVDSETGLEVYGFPGLEHWENSPGDGSGELPHPTESA